MDHCIQISQSIPEKKRKPDETIFQILMRAGKPDRCPEPV